MRIKYIYVDGNKERIYTKKERDKMIKENQDIIFHKDGWLISRSAGH